MNFLNRVEAGGLLAEKLKKYKGKDVVVYALPRGGVETAMPIAKFLNAPLDLIITRKISHPSSPEYAIAAVAENGHIVRGESELIGIDKDWFRSEMRKQRKEVKRRREIYLHGNKMLSPEGKIAILADDGIATGLTLRAGILELKHHNPEKIVIAVPVVPQSTARFLESEVDELIALEIPPDANFLGAVSSYYDSFDQLDDSDVISILDKYRILYDRRKGELVITNGRIENGYFMKNEP